MTKSSTSNYDKHRILMYLKDPAFSFSLLKKWVDGYSEKTTDKRIKLLNRNIQITNDFLTNTKSYEGTGKIYSLSRERVRQIVCKCLRIFQSYTIRNNIYKHDDFRGADYPPDKG